VSERVLVTGATGFVAGHCIRELLDHGYAVRGTVRDLTATGTALDELARRGPLELVEANLESDRGWHAAVSGCTYVLHVASPFPAPAHVPDNEDELIRPAVQGTLRVLRACADHGVKRVVLTSSIAAITAGYDRADHTTRTEDDWSLVDSSPAYQKSKTLAERAAWDYVRGLPDNRRFELVALNPGNVLGPLQRPSVRTSVESVRVLLARAVPGSPHIGFANVDVRDLATAHRLAMETPEAAGNRYICAGEHLWMRDIARILADEFNPRGFRVPTGSVPHWLLWTLARFNKTMRMALYMAGRRELVSADKARRELGWTMRPARETIIDTANSLIQHGICAPHRRSAPSVTPAHANAE